MNASSFAPGSTDARHRGGPIGSRRSATLSAGRPGWRRSSLVGFGWALCEAGVGVDPTELRIFCRAVSDLEPASVPDLYWIGRACLVKEPAAVPVYDELFGSFFPSVADRADA